MAKKAKKATPAKTGKKTATAKKAKKAASAGKTPVTVPVHSVVQFVRMLHERKQADDFFAAAKASKAVVTMDARGVKLVKDYLVARQLQSSVLAAVDDPCPNDPFDCKRFTSR